MITKASLSAIAGRWVYQFQGLDTSNPSSWPLLPRALILVAAYAIAVAVLWVYPLSDFADTLQKAADKESSLRLDFSDKLAKAANLQMLKKQRDEVALTVEGLEKQLPNRTEMSALLFSISQMGRARNLQVELFQPDQSQFKQYYAIIPVTFRAQGGFHDFARFAADVAELPRIVNLSNITITPKAEGVLSIEATVRTYRYLDAAESAPAAKDAKVAK